MKRIIIFIFVLFVFSITDVLAETYPCTYTYEEDKLTFSYDIQNGTYTVSGEKEDDGDNLYSYSYRFYEGEIKGYEPNSCPILYMFYTNFSLDDQDGEYYSYTIYSNSYLMNDSTYSECLDKEKSMFSKCMLGKLGADTYGYYEMHLSDDEENKDKTEFSNCPKTKDIILDIRDKYQLYSEKKEANYILLANKEIEKLKVVCNNILSNMNVQLEGGEKEACVIFCLDIKEILNEEKERYGISSNDFLNDCGISEKLAIWIGNIIRWVKYIIPSVVIIFGILDFIKALGADKEDEMKKAQKKFIRRLIAAALIFIAPFIIEFILDKMGFSSNGCGIIDL